MTMFPISKLKLTLCANKIGIMNFMSTCEVSIIDSVRLRSFNIPKDVDRSPSTFIDDQNP